MARTYRAYVMKPKVNRSGDTGLISGYDQCQTPAYALPPLLKHIPRHWKIWECAAGKGRLVTALREYGYTVIASDIADNSPFLSRNFFDWAPNDYSYDMIITNPPYSIKYPWLKRCYEIGAPFALLIPVESIGAQKAQTLYKEHGFTWIFLDKRVNFEMPNIGLKNSSAQFPVFWSMGRMEEYVGFDEYVFFETIERTKES